MPLQKLQTTKLSLLNGINNKGKQHCLTVILKYLNSSINKKKVSKLEILAELHRPEAHIWGDRRGQPIRSATGSELES